MDKKEKSPNPQQKKNIKVSITKLTEQNVENLHGAYSGGGYQNITYKDNAPRVNLKDVQE